MRKTALERLRGLAKLRGGKCLSQRYVNAFTALKWECAQGHRWSAIPHSIRQGHWCKRCADARLRLPAVRLAELAARRGGSCLAQRYVNSQTPVQWRCAEGHCWFAIPNAIRRGTWCPECWSARRGRARPVQLLPQSVSL